MEWNWIMANGVMVGLTAYAVLFVFGMGWLMRVFLRAVSSSCETIQECEEILEECRTLLEERKRIIGWGSRD